MSAILSLPECVYPEFQMVVCVALGLNGANLYGYVRCKTGAKKKLTSVASNFLGQQVFRSVSNH